MQDISKTSEDMGNFYHGVANLRGFRQGAARSALFLGLGHVRAYWTWMAFSTRRSIVASLLVAVAVLGVSGTSHAGSYGKIDAFVVRQEIRKDLPKINRCYESALRFEPELAGKVSVRFAVVRTGYVKGVQVVENTTGNDSVERCVARIVSALRFPRRREGKSLRFTFPFVFARQD
ncbi:MAG: AgmX/PglI C-terminal domain-containing protein [Myxococcales bacterium]|nr:MAG: AgmX/PglI C-terminal domain-containing protein [Myxococcales bacterium]